MLVAKIFLMIVFLVISFASEETNYSHLSRILRLSNHRSLSRKQQDEPKYYAQCSFVNAWKEHLGYVSVLAFLDPAWQYSFRQAIMLKLLSSRLRKSGFTNIRFFVIAPPPDLIEDKTEDDYEIEAWRKISATYEMEDVNANENLLFKDSRSEIIFFQDDPQYRTWEKFRASKDQVVIIDRCGKLTYQVMVPWSILYFPYVKAAILSTYQEDPCGGCDPTMYQALDYEEYFPSLSITAKETDSRETDNVNVDLIWTTERGSSENGSVYLEESLRKEHEANIVFPVISDKITYDSDDPLNFSSMTESSVMSQTAYRYDNGMTESSLNEYNPKETQIRKDSENSTTSGEIEKLQQDVPPSRDESILMSDNSISEDASDRVLLSSESTVDEIKNEFISMTETTISDTAGNDEIRHNDGDADDLTAEYEQNDSVGKNIEAEKSALSLHIIMRAPHVHRNGKKTGKHTHLILKIGDPDFHGHLDNFKTIGFEVASSEKNNSEIIEADQENATRIYLFDKDESPGLYGEIADYWRESEDSDDTNKNESLNNDTYNNSTISYNEKHHINISNHAITPSKSSEIDENYSTTKITINTYINNSTNSQNTVRLDKTDSLISTSNKINKKKEMQNNLIKHYNKLLSWIDYRLIK
ncbi:uncharacterized protein LOC126855513 [Cataglyphis hispanica]|uniref:uncharacterized protein LOC126855513 n=1 Tax=Cataglyphis hispanica TaxID=1086592 RepID=UPI00217F96A7|nr:uncharacterized protein LOC126855513 [Cataglyphis hispanica]